MALLRRRMDIPPPAVWTVLADGWTYSDWVPGTSTIRDVDAGFPQEGTALHYRVGRGPLKKDGHTAVLEVEPGRRIELEAHAWPAGTARIEITVEPEGSGSLVSIDEYPQRGIAAVLHNPVTDAAVRARNELTLRRLERVARGRADNPTA